MRTVMMKYRNPQTDKVEIVALASTGNTAMLTTALMDAAMTKVKSMMQTHGLKEEHIYEIALRN